MSTNPERLTQSSFKRQLDALGVDGAGPIAVAVSGGADSMCLAFLTKNLNVRALIVDHGLRPESAAEASLTLERLKALSVPAEILTWHHDERPSSNIQAAAREARYELMAAHCRQNGIKTLLTAHHMNDQAETFLLRLNRGSGLAGLAGMVPKRDLENGLTLVRPFLQHRKEQLLEVLKHNSIEWIEDPSNTSETFDRVKARQMLDEPPLKGLTTERLAHTANALGRARRAIEHYVTVWLHTRVDFQEAGYAGFAAESLTTVPEEVGLRALAHLIRFASGQPYGPRFEKLERLFGSLAQQGFGGATLSGARFVSVGGGQVLVLREQAAVAPRAAIAHTTVWDGRYHVEINDNEKWHDLEIGPLEERGAQQVKSELGDQLTIPRDAVLSMPGYFKGDTLIAAPHLGYGDLDKRLPVLTHRWLTSSESGKKTYRGVQ